MTTDKTSQAAQLTVSQYIANLESTLQGFVDAIDGHYRNTAPFCEADEEALEAARALLSSKPFAHVDNFAAITLVDKMITKLAKQRSKGYGGWNDSSDCTKEFLSALLRRHVDKGDPVDVANYCAFLSTRGEGITSDSAPLPLLLRDIARDIGITVPEACLALKEMGYYSTNSAVTAAMASKLREAYPNPPSQVNPRADL